MRKKRSFPFGYQMADGKIGLCLKEVQLVRWIFHSYLAGESIPSLAKLAEAKGVPYHEGDTHWNKNMICRILDCAKYLGDGEYPQMIERETFNQTAAKRASQQSGRLNPVLKEIRDKLCCPRCGNRLSRSAEHRKENMVWICRECGTETNSIADAELLGRITAALNRLLTQPELALVQKEKENHFSAKAMSLTYEINRKLGDPHSDPEQLLGLIQACAQEKYNSCKPGMGRWADDRLNSLLARHQPTEAFNPALFREVVSKVLLSPETAVSLQLINQVII